MGTLIYFLVIAGLFAVVMRFGCGAHVFGHRHGNAEPGDQSRLIPPEKAKDPVCGMIVETAKAKTVMYAGRPYYFCSASCRDKFEAAPASYIDAESAGTSGKEESHGTRHH